LHASIIQKTFKPILAEVIRTCRITFSQELHSIYVYGSVAKGIAKVGISDLDVCVIFNTQTADQERLIVQIQQKLIEKYPILPKIDFDIGYIHDVLLEKNLNYWGAWIKFFCTQIYVDDTIQQAIVAHPDQTNDLVYLNQQLHSSEQADSILLKNLSDIYYWIDEQIFE